jgi:hypothetical protein
LPSTNLVHGDAFTMRNHDGDPITSAEWAHFSKGRFQRRDFRVDVLAGASAFSAEGSLFAPLGKHEIFRKQKSGPSAMMGKLAPFVESALPEPRDDN